MSPLNTTLELLMNTTVQPVASGGAGGTSSGLLDDDIQVSIRNILDNVFKMGFCVAGIITNCINIIVFASIGLTDSITVAFTGLAVSDLGFCLFTLLLQTLIYLASILDLKPYVNLGAVAFVLNFYGFMFYDISITITVFTALQKSACVVIPLKFKHIFTASRSKVIVAAIYLVLVIYFLPLHAMHRLEPKFYDSLNRTRIGLNMTPSAFRDTLLDIFKAFNRILLPFVSEIIIVICTVALTVKLKQASRLRQDMIGEKLTKDKTEEKADGKNITCRSTSLKEVRAIQCVNLVSVIFVICNLPDNIIYFCNLYIPEYSDFGSYSKLFYLTNAIQDVIAVTNAAANVVVYFHYNTKYRTRCIEMIRKLLYCKRRK